MGVRALFDDIPKWAGITISIGDISKTSAIIGETLPILTSLVPGA
jgi:hypothetical protein